MFECRKLPRAKEWLSSVKEQEQYLTYDNGSLGFGDNPVVALLAVGEFGMRLLSPVGSFYTISQYISSLIFDFITGYSR
ncbi:MAG: hypothetical protein ACI4P4_12015 [Faecousia sp.]